MKLKQHKVCCDNLLCNAEKMHNALVPVNNANGSSFDLSFVKGNPSIINWRVFGILKLCNNIG